MNLVADLLRADSSGTTFQAIDYTASDPADRELLVRLKTLAAAANAALPGIEGSTGLDVMQSNWVLKNHAYNTIVTDAFEAGKNAVSATGPSVYSITADPNPIPSAWDPKLKTWGQSGP